MPQESQERVKARVKNTVTEMHLQELREARSLGQKDIAKRMHVKQPAVSKMERSTDSYISTVRGYVEAAGGRLEIVARFPDGGEVVLNQFKEIATLPKRTAKPAAAM
jgi:transcriptional regulator with XRE-family HTH domain